MNIKEVFSKPNIGIFLSLLSWFLLFLSGMWAIGDPSPYERERLLYQKYVVLNILLILFIVTYFSSIVLSVLSWRIAKNKSIIALIVNVVILLTIVIPIVKYIY